MIVIRQNEDTIEQGIVATIGFFDGVHVGHRFLIKELQDWGKELNMPSAVITFPEHPRQVPAATPLRCGTWLKESR